LRGEDGGEGDTIFLHPPLSPLPSREGRGAKKGVTMDSKTALLVGATGLVGGHCLRFLLEDDYYGKVVVLARRKLPLDHEKLEQQVIDFDSLAQKANLIKTDDIYCCLGTTRK
jgi:hypothetical protein